MFKFGSWFATGIVAVLAVLLVASGAAAQNDRSAPIRLLAGTFRPARGESLPLDNSLSSAEPEANVTAYYIVQFKRAIREEWQQELEAQGIEILNYIPDFAYKVRMTPAQAQVARGLQNVGWVGVFQPGYKLAPDLKRGAQAPYTLRIEDGADVARALEAIRATGARVSGVQENVARVLASPEQLTAMARISDVAWIENYVLNIKHNNYGGGIIMGSNIANGNGYDGSTQIAAVGDTGLGNGTPGGAHPDIPAARIVSIKNWKGDEDICFQNIVDDGAKDVDSGHGTHTSGSVLSDGGPGGEGKGVAPAASLVFQAIENWVEINPLCQGDDIPEAGYFLTGLPEKLQSFFQQAYDLGARVHSNSWGSSVAGDYTANSAETDDFINKHRDMTITFSAGNSGTDANSNGIVDFGSLGAPASAKNVITIGASENDRDGHWECDTTLNYESHDLYQPDKTCDDMGGQNLLGKYGQRYPEDFAANPLKNDSTAGNAEQLAAWSSRGPADDGRIKPDLVAPGTWILSTSNNLYQEGYGDPKNPQTNEYAWDGWGMPLNEHYKYMGGTSMSNPLAAGAAVLVRDFYQKIDAHSASAALVKATLINTAVDLLDENNDGQNDNDYPIPNNHEGWGRVDVASATAGDLLYQDEEIKLKTGDKENYTYGVLGGEFLKITLVWTDPPSTENASRNLVNNLDLIVKSPSGETYKGNVFKNGWSKKKGKADKVNNVENVFIQVAEAGDWTITVKAANIVKGKQNFALVIDGAQPN